MAPVTLLCTTSSALNLPFRHNDGSQLPEASVTNNSAEGKHLRTGQWNHQHTSTSTVAMNHADGPSLTGTKEVGQLCIHLCNEASET